MTAEKENPGITYLKSTSHIRVLPEKGDRVRSLLVGIQFGVVMLPYELATVAVGPMLKCIFTDIFNGLTVSILVFRAAASALWHGLRGRLEATEEPCEEAQQVEDEAVLEVYVTQSTKEFEAWWRKEHKNEADDATLRTIAFSSWMQSRGMSISPVEAE